MKVLGTHDIIDLMFSDITNVTNEELAYAKHRYIVGRLLLGLDPGRTTYDDNLVRYICEKLFDAEREVHRTAERAAQAAEAG